MVDDHFPGAVDRRAIVPIVTAGENHKIRAYFAMRDLFPNHSRHHVNDPRIQRRIFIIRQIDTAASRHEQPRSTFPEKLFPIARYYLSQPFPVEAVQ